MSCHLIKVLCVGCRFWRFLLYLVLNRPADHIHVVLRPFIPGLSKAETQALTNYGSGEDENEEEEMEEFAAGPVDVQTSLQASADGQEVCSTVGLTLAR